MAVVADLAISGAMVWYLNKGKTGIRRCELSVLCVLNDSRSSSLSFRTHRSDDMIGRLIAMTITTGVLTT